jgi:hypothetical protein
VAQHVKTIDMQTETIAKKDAEVAQLRADLAWLRCEAPATEQSTQQQALAPTKLTPKKEPKSHARLRPASLETTKTGSSLKRPPSLHVMAQRASALSPRRTRSFGGSLDRGASTSSRRHKLRGLRADCCEAPKATDCVG